MISSIRTKSIKLNLCTIEKKGSLQSEWDFSEVHWSLWNSPSGASSTSKLMLTTLWRIRSADYVVTEKWEIKKPLYSSTCWACCLLSTVTQFVLYFFTLTTSFVFWWKMHSTTCAHSCVLSCQDSFNTRIKDVLNVAVRISPRCHVMYFLYLLYMLNTIVPDIETRGVLH